MRFPILTAIVLTLATAAFAAAATQGSSSALAAWLPEPNTGFTTWSKGFAAVTNQYDYFVCGARRTPSEAKRSLSYAGSACPLLRTGTRFSNDVSGKGVVVYDRVHGIVLYEKGCCAERGVALSAGVGRPPKPVAGANLRDVHTARGVALGMTQAQVKRIYGPTRRHDAMGRPGVLTLSYTTMQTKPTQAGGDACGQFQSFAFRQDRLISIELLAGC